MSSRVFTALHLQAGDILTPVRRAPIAVATIVSKDVRNPRLGYTVFTDSQGETHSLLNSASCIVLRAED